MKRNSWRRFFAIFIIVLDTAAAAIIEAQQTSTNGSFVAGLGCDGDKDTFSLTNDGQNQSWSVTLDKEYQISWIFIRIEAGSFTLTVGRYNANPTRCVDIIKPDEGTDTIEKILTCDGSYSYISGNKIMVSNKEEGPLKIYELKIIGITPKNESVYKNYTNFPEKSKALDNNLITHYYMDKQQNAYWFLTFHSVHLIRWILVSIREGSYELHITTNGTLDLQTTLCKTFSLPDVKRYQMAIECNRALSGNSIILKNTGSGSMRLFELFPIICPANHYGPSCARCSKKCQSCNPITGKCAQCPPSFYGDECQYSCPDNCLDLVCDVTTGMCNGCREKYTGRLCEHEIITPAVTTEMDSVPHSYITTADILATRRKEFTKKQSKHHQVLLVCMLVPLSILLAVGIIHFIKQQKKIADEDEHTVVVFENEREYGVSNNNLELEEIAQNETRDVVEEVLVVENSNRTSQMVSIGQFLEDLPNRKDKGTLEKEFDKLPYGLLEFYSNALTSCNRNRNRYKGIFPYDYNGVKLQTENEKNDVYVNASYIHGFHKEKNYIAAQGPFNPRTLEDFWGMIRQNDFSGIVMLTNLFEKEKMKCLRYSPEVGHDVDIGPYTITSESEDVYDQYTLRNLTLKYQLEEVKTVTQFHFTAWPNNSVPGDVTSLLSFRVLVRSDLTSTEGPIVVHCSAGIGRTGTFIALDYMLEEGAAEQAIDVKGYVISLRHQRGKSIQTREQYIFLHDALAEGLQQNIVQQRCLAVL